jgi:hypothetical protein
LTDPSGLLTFTPPLDPWVDPFMLSLYTNDPLYVGMYAASFQVDLASYEMHSIFISFYVVIIQLKNNLPYFETTLPGEETI